MTMTELSTMMVAMAQAGMLRTISFSGIIMTGLLLTIDCKAKKQSIINASKDVQHCMCCRMSTSSEQGAISFTPPWVSKTPQKMNLSKFMHSFKQNI